MRAIREFPEPWGDEPGPRDLAAAYDYLCLIFEPRLADRLAEGLAAVETIRVHRATDILRAAGIKPLRRKDPAVRAELDRFDRGQRYAPVLLVRDVTRHVVIVADGFERLCAGRLVNEDAVVPCRIVTTS
jgi:hypothetical protein